jgi:hypothetical protein
MHWRNELGRLAQGIENREKGTNTIFFIPHSQIPPNRRKDVTYGRICVDHRPKKKETNRTRLTAGGNLIDFPGDVSTPTADPTTAKLFINHTPQACLINNHHIKVGHSMGCFSATTRIKSTVYVSFCLSWTMVRGLWPLLWALICENKIFYPTILSH